MSKPERVLQRVNQKQIGSMLNLSQSTVSRALSGSSGVDEKTRRIVLEAAETLGYTPNYLAQSLVLKRTRHLCYVVPSFGYIQSEVTSSILAGVGVTADKCGYRFTLVAETQERLVTLVSDGMYDGLFLTVDNPENIAGQLQQIADSQHTIVLVNSQLDSPQIHCVTADNRQGGYVAACYLRQLGHRRIAFVGPLGVQIGQERLQGFRDAFRKDPVDERYIINMQWPKRIEELDDRVAVLLKMQPLPTAFIVASDLIAVGLIRCLGEQGMKVPEDVSIIGFDDIATAAYNIPPLTTVRVPGYEIGCEAMGMMYRLLNNKTGSRRIKVPVHLIERGSCAPPRRV
ncbi:MAG: LacI family DNA-binding transcriptional regulator [Limnochordia bacterium]|nr:LacI family DNA-binding transcriptional regulator [Limnochordia bacterium]